LLDGRSPNRYAAGTRTIPYENAVPAEPAATDGDPGVNGSDTRSTMAAPSTTRLYGAAIAVVSGLYSAWLATTGGIMTPTAWFMLVLGIVVLVHGVTLLTPAAGYLGEWSGPLMIVYALLMLGTQALMAWMVGVGEGMDGGTGGGMGSGTGGGMQGGMGVGVDPGMVAIALLMLASGLIMSSPRGRSSDSEM
jgi:hypothetical protein